MRLTPTKVTKANGEKLINGYRIVLSKSECEKHGYKAGDEFKAEYSETQIILKKQ